MDERKPLQAGLTAVVLLAHAVLALLTVLVTGLQVMGTANCAYVECGDQRWAGEAMGLAMVGSAALLVLDVVIAVWRMVIRRRALPVALIGLGAQLVLWVVCMVMMAQAGPVS
ncbi:uncharacterized membrane protein (UPF0136 family) [Mycolicibacterium iranicum]|uniref:Uncharacterized membrane protein (UPF0136 family) n=1 Tax=Mycolicibacterium iranicum TaxID=912594 RepID=A0A839QC78_MYCIR|nr:hypothetical protein [Mycolicibacterium iranicum]MBB2990842.1 uncharacterized membrane protein (UPF0136 family) [Mycolicibacterium iranicum]